MYFDDLIAVVIFGQEKAYKCFPFDRGLEKSTGFITTLAFELIYVDNSVFCFFCKCQESLGWAKLKTGDASGADRAEDIGLLALLAIFDVGKLVEDDVVAGCVDNLRVGIQLFVFEDEQVVS